MIAKVTKKLPWTDGTFTKNGPYRTRQMFLLREEDGKSIRINISDNKPKSMRFNDLKVDDRISEFKMLNTTNIHPESDFKLYNPNALF